MSMFDLPRRYLNCLKVTSIVPILSQVLITVLHIFLCHLFMTKMELELFGLGLAFSITGFLLLVATTTYAYYFAADFQSAMIAPDATAW